jgi:hypothetical protein
MAENRLAREIETRSTQERPKQWQRPETLPQPDKATRIRLSLGSCVFVRSG